MIRKLLIDFFLFFLCLSLVACTAAPPTLPTPTNPPSTRTPGSTSTTSPGTSSPTPAASHTLLPEPTITSIVPTRTRAAPSPTSTPCIDKARFVSETIPDDTEFDGGTTFEKSWTLENTGTCTWTEKYQFVQVSSEGMSLERGTGINLPWQVAPGEKLVIAVRLKVPTTAGMYRTDFKLLNPGGGQFGIGSAGTSPVYVRIIARQTAVSATSTPGSQTSCTYRASFVSETLPDNSKVFSGEIFVKTFTVKNSGTCEWIGIRLPWVSDGGLSFPPGVPRADNPHGDVAPGETITLGWPIIAPSKAGTYRADFNLGVADDTLFGLGAEGKTPLYVQIVVVEPPSPLTESALGLGEPNIKDIFDKNNGWWLPQDLSYVKLSMQNGSLFIDVNKNVPFWTMRTLPKARGSISQAVIKTGEACQGDNGYGLIVGLNENTRTGYYTNGYLLRLNCQGQYRLIYIDPLGWEIGGPPKVLVPDTASSAILSGPGQVNRITIITAGGSLSFYVNGSKLLELSGFNATQFENGAITSQFELDLSQFEYYDLPYNGPGLPGIFIEGRESNFSITVDEFSYWNLENMIK